MANFLPTLDAPFITDLIDADIRDLKSRSIELSKCFTRWDTNRQRVIDLLGILDGSPSDKPIEKAYADVFRAALVFAHASFEDLLRNLGRLLLPISSTNIICDLLNQDKKRAWLEEIMNRRGTTVQDFANELIKDHLDKKAFSDTTKVASYLKLLGIDSDKFGKLLPAISEIIQRRHDIVHEADLRRDEQTARPITIKDVKIFLLGFGSITIAVAAVQDQLTKRLVNEVERIATKYHNISLTKPNNALPIQTENAP